MPSISLYMFAIVALEGILINIKLIKESIKQIINKINI